MKKALSVILCLLTVGILLAACSTYAPAPVPTPTDVVEEAPLITAVAVSLTGDTAPLTVEQQRLLTALLTKWYHFIGSFEEEDFAPLFDGTEEPERHGASCRTQAAIRAAVAEDLRLTDCTVTLTVQGVSTDEDGVVHITAMEDTVMHFAGIPGVDSQLIALPHIFTLARQEGGAWRIRHHEADDNPYFSFTYAPGTGLDGRYDQIMANIAARQENAASPTDLPECDHPYDRDAALAYMLQYCAERNPDWKVYDEMGGNCMNFASQVLLAGGIPMDREGADRWYWDDAKHLSKSFVTVDAFANYARDNTGYGLVAEIAPDDGTGQVGDLLLMGIDEPRHTTEICGLVTDGSGNTVDYLLCSNTTNYRDFPAGAYYYTAHWLVKVWGWND